MAESARGMVLELCELGWLYKKVTDYVQKHSDNVGLASSHRATQDRSCRASASPFKGSSTSTSD